MDEILNIKCSNCGKELINACIVDPNGISRVGLKEIRDWNVVAKCDWCKDQSFKMNIRGTIYIGPTKDSRLLDTLMDGNNLTVLTTKGNPDWSE